MIKLKELYKICKIIKEYKTRFNLHQQLRTRRALLQLKDVLLRIRRVLSLYKVYGDSALLILNGISLSCNNALLILNRISLSCNNALLAPNWRYSLVYKCTTYLQTSVQVINSLSLDEMLQSKCWHAALQLDKVWSLQIHIFSHSAVLSCMQSDYGTVSVTKWCVEVGHSYCL